MTGKDLSNNIFAKQSIAPATIVATTNGSAVDARGYGSACAVISLGTEGQTLTGDNFWTFKIQGCATSGGTYTDLTAAMMIEPAANSLVIDAPADAPGIYQMGFRVRDYRYFRVVCTESGTISTGTLMEAIIVLGDPASAPTAALTAPA